MVKNIIKEKRIEQHLTQEELAQAVGVTRQTIHAIESEKYTASLELALILADFFKTPVEHLFTLERKHIYEQKK